MTAFLNSKRWELVLAVVIPFVLPLLDAWQTGAFSGKDVTTGMVIALGVVLRAAASHRQEPATTPLEPLVSIGSPSAPAPK